MLIEPYIRLYKICSSTPANLRHNQKQYSGGIQACNFIKKETLAQVFSCEFCEISKNTYLYRRPLVAASVRKMVLFYSFTSNSENLMKETPFYFKLKFPVKM